MGVTSGRAPCFSDISPDDWEIWDVEDDRQLKKFLDQEIWSTMNPDAVEDDESDQSATSESEDEKGGE